MHRERLTSLKQPERVEKSTVLYTSTNKVYGEMEDVSVVEGKDAYEYADFPDGISSQIPGFPFTTDAQRHCDQYMRDYHRIYGLRTVVLRQSCIYGHASSS